MNCLLLTKNQLKAAQRRMELPLYSAVVHVVRHHALLEHFFKTMVCGQRSFNDEVGKTSFFLLAQKSFFFMPKNDRVYAAL